MDKKEEWRDLPDYGGSYKVSNLGRVKSMPKNWDGGGFIKKQKAQILDGSLDKLGRRIFSLRKNGQTVVTKLSDMMALVWPEPIKEAGDEQSTTP